MYNSAAMVPFFHLELEIILTTVVDGLVTFWKVNLGWQRTSIHLHMLCRKLLTASYRYWFFDIPINNSNCHLIGLSI